MSHSAQGSFVNRPRIGLHIHQSFRGICGQNANEAGDTRHHLWNVKQVFRILVSIFVSCHISHIHLPWHLVAAELASVELLRRSPRLPDYLSLLHEHLLHAGNWQAQLYHLRDDDYIRQSHGYSNLSHHSQRRQVRLLYQHQNLHQMRSPQPHPKQPTKDTFPGISASTLPPQ